MFVCVPLYEGRQGYPNRLRRGRASGVPVAGMIPVHSLVMQEVGGRVATGKCMVGNIGGRAV
jgi:hypothetical protein